MINLQDIIRQPNNISEKDVIQDWFNNIGQYLLNNYDFYYFTSSQCKKI
jgi:hypothetical protein